MHVVLCLTAGLIDLSALPSRLARPAHVARPSIHAIAPAPEEVAAPRKAAKERLNIRIDDEWYDLTNWRVAHPAGAHWIDAYKGADATEVRPCPSVRPILIIDASMAALESASP